MWNSSIVLASVLSLSVALLTSSPAAASETIQWTGPDGQVAWSAAIDPDEAAGGGEPLLARPWFPPLASLEFPQIGGEDALRSEDFAGSVTILDFWTSWCGPCAEELPRMQAFHERNRERGLITLAINVREHRLTALSAAAGYGLHLPLIEYTKQLEEAFGVKRIPTIIVVDRLGRVRNRWETFPEDTEQRIYEWVDQMLEPGDAAMEPIARHVRGRGVRVRWLREFRFPVHTVETIESEPQQIAAAIGRNLHVMGADASTDEFVESEISLGRLVASEPDDDGGYSVLAYRLGGTRLSRFDFPDKKRIDWESPAPILDVRWVNPDEPGTGAVVGTMDGLVRVDSDGKFGDLNGAGVIRGISRVGGETPGWVALTGREERQWRRFSDDLEELDLQPVDGAPWRLEGLGSNGHSMMFPSKARAVAAGRFFPGIEHEQIAVASDKAVVVFDSATGAELSRIAWDGIGGLAAGDLDGDGRDELYVSWGNRLAALECLD